MKCKFPKKIRLAGQCPSVKQLDDLCREAVRKRDKKCRRCGRTTNLQVAHFFSRRNRAVRWDLDNVFLLCGGCHFPWAHQNPFEFSEFVRKELGDKVFQRFVLRATAVSKVDLQMVGLYLTQELKRLKIIEE